MLAHGIDASNIDNLMQAMVYYLAQLAENTSGSNVAKTEIYKQIGGSFTYSDIRAITNLANQASVINSIANNKQNYATSVQSFTNQLSGLEERTPVQVRVENLIDNALLTIGNKLLSGSDNGMTNYVWYRISEMLPGILGDLGSTAWAIKNIGPIAKGMKDTFVNLGESAFSSIFQYMFNTSKLQNIRGASYTPFQAGAWSTNSGISYSSSLSNAISASSREYDLYQQAHATTLSASNTTGTAGIIRDVGDIFAELFEQQNHPIRVSIAKVEDEAKETGMRMTLSGVDGKAKEDLGIGFKGLLVDVQNDDINTIVNQVYTIRGAY